MKMNNLLAAAISIAAIILVIMQTYVFVEQGEEVNLVGPGSMDVVGQLFLHLGIPFFLLLMSYHFKYPFHLGKGRDFFKSSWPISGTENAWAIYFIFAISTTMFIVVFFMIVALSLTYAMLAIIIVGLSPLVDYINTMLLFKWVLLLVIAEVLYSTARFIPNIHTVRWTEKFLRNFKKARQFDERLFFGSITIALLAVVGKTILSTLYLANLVSGGLDMTFSEPVTAFAALVLTIVPIEWMKRSKILRSEFNEAFDLEDEDI